jgi:hypothetical protein
MNIFLIMHIFNQLNLHLLKVNNCKSWLKSFEYQHIVIKKALDRTTLVAF